MDKKKTTKHKCKICGKSFGTNWGLQVHHFRKHPESYEYKNKLKAYKSKKRRARRKQPIHVDLSGGTKLIGVPLLVTFSISLEQVKEGKI
jgi:hypothetical protein